MSGQQDAVLSPWGYAIAGAAGAVMANATVYPLDIIKTKLQVQDKTAVSTSGEPHYDSTLDAVQKIYGEEGFAGLYAGIEGSLIGTASSSFAYFYWYTIVRDTYFKYRTTTSAPSTAVELSLGALAGAIAQIFTIPISVVTTRQQTQLKKDRKSLLGTAKEVIDSEDGVSGLWRGLKASLVLCVNPAITYGTYQRLKDVMFPGKKNLRPAEAFLLGAMSKSLATFATQPLIVAKVGLQSRPPPSRKGKAFKSFPEVMEYIIRNEGIMGLFKGIAPQLMKGIIVQGLLMMTKERIEFIFILFFRYLTTLRKNSGEAATAAVEKVNQSAAVGKLVDIKSSTGESLAGAQYSAAKGLATVQTAASDALASVQTAASAKLSSLQTTTADVVEKAKQVVPVTTK